VAEAVPLGAALGVERVEIVVRDAGGDRLDRMREFVAIEDCRRGEVEWHARHPSAWTLVIGDRHIKQAYFTGITSPVLISFAAAATRVGVSKFNLPSPSSGPHTQAAPGGAPGMLGRLRRVGNSVRSGFHGMASFLLLETRASVIFERRLAGDDIFAQAVWTIESTAAMIIRRSQH
jgi:hypothetical protein